MRGLDQLAVKRRFSSANRSRFAWRFESRRAVRSAGDHHARLYDDLQGPHPRGVAVDVRDSRDRSVEIQRLSPVEDASLPSSVMAHLAITHGLPVDSRFK